MNPSLPPWKSIPVLRREYLRPLLRHMLEAGLLPWVIEQALSAEAHDFERVSRQVDPLRELEALWKNE